MDPNPFAVLSFIVAPAVLTNASAILTLSTGNRLARAVDRARGLTAELDHCEAQTDAVTLSKRRELAAAQQRMLLLIRGLQSFYFALGGFACAALVALLGALLTPVVVAAVAAVVQGIALLAGSAAVAALVRGASLLVRETRIAVAILEERAARVHKEYEAWQLTHRDGK
jgi:hypothetical protein